MKQEEKYYNENQLGMVFFLYNFPETLDKQREIGGEAFIAKKQGGKPNEKLYPTCQRETSRINSIFRITKKRCLFYIKIRILVVIESSHLKL